MGISVRELSLLILTLVGVVCAERPFLDLFGGGASVTRIEVLVDTTDGFTAPLVTNDDTENLVTDTDEDIQYVIANINGRLEESEELVLDTTDISLPVVTDVREDGEIEIRIGTGQFNASAANFSVVLAVLSYRSNLTSSALSDPQRNVTITAYDEVGPSNTLTALIELRVPNRDAPVFTQNGIYATSLAENSADGTEISVTVSATDPEGRAVTYSTSSSVFAIDDLTGVLNVIDSGALDYEDRTQFELTIVASDDDPISPLTSEATLTVTLININDNDPIFDQDSYGANVPENVENAVVVTVSATDNDGDTLQYLFADSTTGNTFRIESGTGIITVEDQLDYEDITMYTFNVIVSDGVRVDTASVVVNVTDVADGRPVVLPLQKDILLNLDDGKMSCIFCVIIMMRCCPDNLDWPCSPK